LAERKKWKKWKKLRKEQKKLLTGIGLLMEGPIIEVRRSHAISQKKLNGKPRITGSMRSHRDTEKHIATKGISANKIAPRDGFRIEAPGRAEDV